jgi:hypothetical protein
MQLERALIAAGVGASLWLTTASAEAYRPFDGTDANVADLKEFELELGPVHYYRLANQDFLIAPALVLNLGIFDNTELVIDAQDYLALGTRNPGLPRASLRNDDVLLKHVFREGILQGKTGLSIAAEGGVLTPEVHGASSFGASLSLIGSYAWPCLALHFNEWFQFTRLQRADLFSGVIAEGPQAWQVRPVAEFSYDRDSAGSRSTSLLLGAIWSVRETLALDAGLRGARLDDAYAVEARLGLTWSVSFAKPPVRDGTTPL